MKIYAISESFSAQPVSIRVGSTFILENDKTTKIARIELERIERFIDSSPSHSDYYVGYDDENRRMFEYRADTVNVNYY